MKSLTNSRELARERRAEYIRLRLAGTGKYEAATAVGVDDQVTRSRYERWFEAERPDRAVSG